MQVKNTVPIRRNNQEITVKIKGELYTDVRRSRVRNRSTINFDIHDRVNYAAEKSDVILELDSKTITLDLKINTEICAVMDYFEIFTGRMLLCRKAADALFQSVSNIK